jgi:integrase
MTGRRINELHALRTDGKNETVPGFTDGRSLYFENRRTHKGASGFVELHDALAELLRAHGEWRMRRQEISPWYFPGRRGAAVPVDKAAVTRGLARACALLDLPHRTSHGLRSYYVNVLRSDGLADYEIALRIGQKSGGRMIVDVYGERRPGKLLWLPEGQPAWKVFEGAGAPANIVAFK